MAATCRLGKWVTADLTTVCKIVSEIPSTEIISSPSLLALQSLIETDPEVFMLFTKMFSEKFEQSAPTNPIKDYKDMIQKMQYIIKRAPEYNSMLSSMPIYYILLYVMATPSGTIAFINKEVNERFKAILNEWAVLLDGKESQYSLDTEYGWLCKWSLEKMPDFVETYDCDPSKPFYGFESFNAFFARRLKSPDVRPVAYPCDPYIVTAPCEAVSYYLDKDPKFRDDFWIKSEPYSLQHLLNDDPSAPDYVGGTIFQAFLNPSNYHRWHAPVDGKITKAYVKEGAYYTVAVSAGYGPAANTDLQRYFTHLNTRAIIMIDTKGHANVGAVIMVAVGIAEISSCEINERAGKVVKKGDPLGTFKYGGSAYCILFKKDVEVIFTAQKDPASTKRYPELKRELQLVNSHLATIKRA